MSEAQHANVQELQTQEPQTQEQQTQEQETQEQKERNFELELLMSEYVNQMSVQERKVLKIAQSHLHSSFSMEKSIGFKQWLSEQGKKI